MKRVILLTIPLLATIIFNLSCDYNVDSNDHKPHVLYYNPFENEADLKEWQMITVENLIDDPSPNGGNKSLQIAGGCLIPHASLTLNPPADTLMISLELFGKKVDKGGVVQMMIGKNLHQAVSINISDSVWKKYACESSFVWPADSQLTIWMMAGGFVPSAMRVDELKIIECD